MNPDVVGAIGRLQTRSVLSDGQAAHLGRVARGHLVSIRLELRALLYVGVLLLASGVGLLVVEHHRAIGRWVIAASVALAAAACLAWVARQAPAFSWQAVPSPSVAFDYILLLGLLLLAAGLAYVEAQFTVLGPRWAHHLLVVAAVYLLAAYRWDSPVVLGLALSTLAAWRGLSVGLLAGSAGAGEAAALRLDALALGALFLSLAALSVRTGRKAHFEEVFGNAGLLLLLGALVWGALGAVVMRGLWLAALLLVAMALMWVAFRLGRSLYFVQGVLAAYVGLLRLVFASARFGTSSAPFVVAAVLGVAALALVFTAHRRMAAR